MKLAQCVALVASLGAGLAAAQGCTSAASVCTGSACAQTDAGVSRYDAGAPGADDDSGMVIEPEASSPADPCNACLYGECVAQYSDCVADPACLTIYECATAPPCAADGGTCIHACVAGEDAGAQALYLALTSCNDSAECSSASAPCASVCNTACPPVADSGAGATSDGAAASCASCQGALCASELAACASGTECADYNECVLGCSGTACDSACKTGIAAGYAAASSLASCTSSHCPQCD